MIDLKLVLGIESTCDETAASVTADGRKVLSDVIFSQADLHKKYGGVVPEIASRKHTEVIAAVICEALKKAGVRKEELDAVAVSHRPGLIGAVLVGLSVAKGFAYAIKKPLVPVNHIHGHISANYIASPSLEPPFVCLVASGGHSHIIRVNGYTDYEILGATLDDAAGEAFDKVARVLGLGYPGGPLLSRMAQDGNAEAIRFPRPINGVDFSFSGIKTSVINYMHRAEQNGENVNRADIAASFQSAVVDVLTDALMRCAESSGVRKIAIAGGVASNRALRESIKTASAERGYDFFLPPPELCTDNGAMISCAGYYNFMAGMSAELDINAYSSYE